MILNSELLKQSPQFFQTNFRDYTLLRTDHYEWGQDKKVFEDGIQVWNLCNCLRVVNKFLSKSKLAAPINYEILFEVLKYIEDDADMSDDKMIEYLEFIKRLEELCDGLTEITPSYSEVMYIHTETDLTLIGFNAEKRSRFKSVDREAYYNAWEDIHQFRKSVLDGKFPLEDYKSTALKLMETELKKAEKAEKK